MSSIIEGYNYDIFISYRQKDNKGDRWVSKFVETLKTELEATFKEDISVYFDENPHDRLQETHNVDKSLEGKLKCLIFIPILSQTYCDPNSYAWQYEFLAFLRIAEKDQFGRDVRLRSGNVTSRILPIRIHDLEQEDIKLFEKETGSVLRAMDFVFKTASGVSRPLKTNEDHPQDNLNKTFYSDQINKVGHAIKEIIQGMKSEPDSQEIVRNKLKGTFVETREEGKSKEISGTALINQKSKKWLIILLSLVLCIVGVFVVFKIIQAGKTANDIANLEKSIAVLPFKLLSDEPDKQYLADGMMDAITLHLSKIKDLQVMPRTSVEQYRGTTKTTRQIGKELDVEYLLEGSFQKFGDNVKLIVQLINASEESHEWAKDYDRNWKDIFSVQSEVAKEIANELNAAISPEEKQLIEKSSTKNLTAYDYFLLGDNEHWKYWSNNDPEHINRSIEYFMKAIEEDPDYSQAYVGLGQEYWMLGHYALTPSADYWEEATRLLKKAIELDPKNGEAYSNLGVIQHNWNCDSSAARYSFKIAFSLSPNNDTYYLSSKFLEYRLGNCARVASIIEEWSKINPSIGPPSSDLMLLTCQSKFDEIRRIADQEWSYNTGIQDCFYYYIAYINNGNYDIAQKIAESMENKSDDPSVNLSIRGHILSLKGDREGAKAALLSLKKLSESRYVSNIYFANIFYALGDKEKTLEYLERAFQERDWRIRAFYDVTAFNLIKKDEPWLDDFIRRSWIPLIDSE